MTFYPTPHHLLQDFCKKTQWRAKKLRERGSNAARPPKKGGGGSPDWSQPVAIGRAYVAIGRNRSLLVATGHATGRNRSQPVTQPVVLTSQPVVIGRYWSCRRRDWSSRRHATGHATGRDWSCRRRATGRYWSQPVAIGRAGVVIGRAGVTQPVAIGRNQSLLVATGRNRS